MLDKLSNLEQASAAIRLLIEVLEEENDPDLSGVISLLCCAGAACHDPKGAEELLSAVQPIMTAKWIELQGRNN